MERARDDIHAPDLPGHGEWVGGDPGKMDVLLARGPVLVHFFDYSQLNSVRTLPYLAGWQERYGSLGLTVLGIQAPRFPVGDRAEAEAGIARLGIEYPVLLDFGMEAWKLYGCEGWPSLFLWGRGGSLRWFHFGEGEYHRTEEAIRESLGPSAGDAMPDPMEPIRETDGEGVQVVAPSPEFLPGGDGPWVPGPEGSSFAFDYEAGAAFATVGGAGTLTVSLDDGEPRSVAIEGPGLYELATHEAHGSHRIEVTADGAPEVWSVSFAPARFTG